MPKKSAETQVGTSGGAAGATVTRRTYPAGPLEIEVVEFSAEPSELRGVLAAEMGHLSETALDTLARLMQPPLEFSDDETEEQRRIKFDMGRLYRERAAIIEAFQALGFYGETDDTSVPVVLRHDDERGHETYYGRIRFDGARIILETLAPHTGTDGQEWDYISRDIDLRTGYLTKHSETWRGKADYRGVPYNEVHSHSNIPGIFLTHMHGYLSDLRGDAIRSKRKLDPAEFDFDAELKKLRAERGVDSDYAMARKIPELIHGIASYSNPELGEKSEGVYTYSTGHMTITVGAATGIHGDEQVSTGSIRLEYKDANGHGVVEQYVGLDRDPALRRHNIKSEDPARSAQNGNYYPVTHEDLVEVRSLLEDVRRRTRT